MVSASLSVGGVTNELTPKNSLVDPLPLVTLHEVDVSAKSEAVVKAKSVSAA
jgi:hypothetical protein